jgi:nucleoside-diphosphate-sugar epimerase
MQLIVGAGAVGSTLARDLADAGEPVRLVTRSGSGPSHPLISLVAADAADAGAIRRLAEGATVVYNAANPEYHRWPELWPPIAKALVAAAKDNDAVLAITGNLYVYGPVDRPMTEDMPLAATTVKGRVRVQMWEEALASGAKVLEARGSDYISPKHSLLEMALPAIRSGKTAWLPSSPDIPHTFTYTGDMARTMIALSADPRAWGRAWHVPSAPAMTIRQLLTRVAQVAGVPSPKLAQLPFALVRAAGLWDKFAREYLEMSYQFKRPFELDSSLVTRTFGLVHTPVDEALRSTLGPVPVAAERTRS